MNKLRRALMRLVSSDGYFDRKHRVEEFTAWVCSEVLLSIRKSGSYTPNEEGIKRYLLIDDTPEYADKRIKEPEGETEFHDAVVEYNAATYPRI